MKSHYLMYRSEDATEFSGGVDLAGEHSSVELSADGITLTVRGLDSDDHDEKRESRVIRILTLQACKPGGMLPQPSLQEWEKTLRNAMMALREDVVSVPATAAAAHAVNASSRFVLDKAMPAIRVAEVRAANGIVSTPSASASSTPWESAATAEGQTYFHNKETDETRWADPTLGAGTVGTAVDSAYSAPAVSTPVAAKGPSPPFAAASAASAAAAAAKKKKEDEVRAAARARARASVAKGRAPSFIKTPSPLFGKKQRGTRRASITHPDNDGIHSHHLEGYLLKKGGGLGLFQRVRSFLSLSLSLSYLYLSVLPLSTVLTHRRKTIPFQIAFLLNEVSLPHVQER
jgi:hypothetical protein